LRILLINKFYYLSGGAERYVFEWQRLLRERGHETAVFSMAHPRNKACAESRWFAGRVDFDQAAGPVARLRAAGRSIFSLEARAGVRGLVREFRPDLAHVHSYCYQLTPSIFGPLRQARVPVVQTAHEYYHVCANQHLYDPVAGAVCERCLRSRWAPLWTRCVKGSAAASAAACAAKALDDWPRLSRRGIGRVVAPSRFMRDKMIEFGWPAERIAHVPNFVDTAAVEPAQGAGDYVLFVGRLVRHKGPMTLLRAAESLPGVPVKVAGEGPMEQALRAFARERGLSNVEFLGFCEGEALSRAVAGSRCVAVPSEWYENAPLVVLEAMAAGRAVVASDIGGIAEQVRHGREGLLFRPGDAAGLVACLRRLWDNPGKAAALGAGGRTRAEQEFSAEAHYRRMMQVFDEARGLG